MQNVTTVDTCAGYGDGIDVFYNDDKLAEAQDEVNEEAASNEDEPDTVVVVIELPSRRAALDLDGISALRAALDAAEKVHSNKRQL